MKETNRTGRTTLSNGNPRSARVLSIDPPDDSHWVDGEADFTPAPPPDDGALHFTPLSAFLSEPPDTRPHIWQGCLLHAAFSMLFGQPKAGKSSLALTLAYHIVTGTPFLDRATTQGPVLLISLEDKRAELQKKLSRFPLPPSAPLFIHTGPVYSDPEIPPILDQLYAAIVSLEPTLIIVDTMARFISFADLNDYAEACVMLAPFQQLARTTGTHIMFIHHARKVRSERKAGGFSVLGSNAIVAGADTALFLELAHHSERRRIVYSTQRYGDDIHPALPLDFCPSTGLFIPAPAADPLNPAVGRFDTLILEALRTAGDSLSRYELAAAARCKPQSLVLPLSLMTRRGLLVREGKGIRNDPHRYSLAPTPPGAVALQEGPPASPGGPL